MIDFKGNIEFDDLLGWQLSNSGFRQYRLMAKSKFRVANK